MGVIWSSDDDAKLRNVLDTAPNLEAAARMASNAIGRTISVDSLRNRATRIGIKASTSLARRSGDKIAYHLLSLVAEKDPFPQADLPTDPLPPPMADGDDGVDIDVSGLGVPPVPTTSHATSIPPADRSYVDRGPKTYDFEPLDLGSKTLERTLLIPDTHGPFHDKRAWATMVAFAKGYRPHTVVHVGDWADCFTVSAHDRDPRRASQLEDELRIVKELREEIDNLPGVQRKICTLGNHEYRLERYLMQHAPAIISMLDIAQLMGLPQNGWKVVPYHSHGRIGKMHVAHDAGHAGVHAVHHTGNAFGASILFGHTHRLGLTYFGDVLGRRHVSASLGWLGDLAEAAYIEDVKKRYWTHGFGTAEMMRNGRFQLELVPIVDYRCVRAGQVVEVAA